MPSPISIGRTALLAGIVCLTVGCASLDTRMKRFVGKPIDAVIKSYGVEPTEGRVKSENNRYAYLWRYTYYSYGGREYEGSSQPRHHRGLLLAKQQQMARELPYSPNRPVFPKIPVT